MRHRFAVAIVLLAIFEGLLAAQAPSSVTLTAPSSSAIYGQPVTLTATVTAGATGKVTFYDGATILGIGKVSNGQASTTTIMLPTGTRQLRAHYSGDAVYSASNSSTVTMTVAARPSLGLRPAQSYTTTYPVSSMTVGDFDGDNHLDVVMVSYYGNTITVLLNKGDGTFYSGVDYGVGNAPEAAATGDFNGDGILDIAVASYGGTISILLGKGDGTFQAAVNYAAPGAPSGIAVADFDGDGVADLVVSNNSSSHNANILLGKGDGTFQTAASLATGYAQYGVAVADFNGDSTADLVFMESGLAAVLLGKGDGTFPTSKTVLEPILSRVCVTDLNNDGKPDLVFYPTYDDRVGFALGLGDGTFATPSVLYMNFSGTAILADFDGDGKIDIADVSPYSATTLVLIAAGNADGTFRTGQAFSAPGSMNIGVAGDFDGDGKVDVVLASNSISGTHSWALMPGGAVPDLTVSASHGAGLTQGQQGATYTITATNSGDVATSAPMGVVATLPAGLQAVSMGGTGWTCALSSLACSRSDALAAGSSYPPIILKVNVTANPGVNVTSTFLVAGGGETNTANDSYSDTAFIRYATVLTLSPSPATSVAGQSVSLTATTTSGATGRILFYNDTTQIGSASIAAGKAVFATSTLPSGVRNLHAAYLGDSQYGPSISVLTTVTVGSIPGNGVTNSATYKVDSLYLMVVADVNGDGKPDLITANSTGTATGLISVLINSGNGNLKPAVNYGTSVSGLYTYSTSGLVAGDFNNDGKTDVLVIDSGTSIFFAGIGDGTFSAGQSGGTVASGINPVAVDVNGDGYPDLVADVNSTLMVYFGNGDGTFQTGTSLLPSGVSTYTFQFADLNRDGIPDLVVQPSNASTWNVYLGRGDGTFLLTASISENANYVTIGDYTGDGKADLVFFASNAIDTYPGNGDGTFKSAVHTTGYYGGSNVLMADFNGDGKLDVAYYSYSDSLIMIFGNGDGTFQTPVYLQFNNFQGHVATADFNGDGRPDIAYTTGGAVNIALGTTVSGLSINVTHFRNFTAGQTGSYQINVTNNSYTSFTGTVTVNDLLPSGLTATAITGGQYSSWTCTLLPLSCGNTNGIGTLQSYPTITVSVKVANLPYSILTNQASVIVNGIVSSANDSTTVLPPTTTTLQPSSASAAAGQPITLTATVSPVAATGWVEFSDNGLALASVPLSGGTASYTTRLLQAGPHGIVAIYSGDATHASSNSTYTTVTVNAAQTSGFLAPTNYSAGAGPQAMVTADFNGDGKLDLATANSGANTVSVWLNSGNGAFGTRTDYPVGAGLVALSVVDINRDGLPDLAVACQGANTVSILLGKSDGTFQPALNYAIGWTPYQIAAADVEHDGNPDLIVRTSNGILLLFGNGDGTFQAPVFPGLSNYLDLVADWNRDGKVDILNAYYLSTWLGNGDGTFQTVGSSQYYSGGSAAEGDLNGDGIPDAVIAYYGRFYVFLGIGDGTFKNPVATNTPYSSNYALALADVNGDGMLDIVTAATNGANIYFGNGDGTMQAPVFQSLPVSPTSILAADFNGDGRTDLAFTSTYPDSLTILLGTLTQVLTIQSSHSGSFNVGQTGATYTLTATNLGPGATSGMITVTDTLPSGMTATAITGNHWTCTLATVSCTRSDSVAQGANFDPITVTVTVTAANGGPVTNQASITGDNAVTGTASDTTTITGAAITIQTSPAGLQFTIDGSAAQTAPQTIGLTPGNHTVAVAGTQSGSPGTRYAFTQWSDSGAASHSITVGSTPVTYTASFKTQYLLTAAATPLAGGTVTPASGSYYDLNASVPVQATAVSPYLLEFWTGDLSGNNPSMTLNMDGPKSITAAFAVPGAKCDLSGDGWMTSADAIDIAGEVLAATTTGHDLNGDGAIDIRDVQKVVNAISGQACL